MDLSFWVTTLSLAILVFAGWTWVNGAYITPRKASRAAASGAQGVKTSPRPRAFRQRSRRSNVQNVVNAGSTQQEAPPPPVNVPNVQDSSTSSTTPAGAADGADGAFTLSARELVQLAEAIHLRAEGATVEAAVCRAFGVSKGGSEGYRRAKALFDAATVPPGAAPVGTYAAPAPPARRRAARAR